MGESRNKERVLTITALNTFMASGILHVRNLDVSQLSHNLIQEFIAAVNYHPSYTTPERAHREASLA